MDSAQWEQDATEKQQRIAELEQELSQLQQELQQQIGNHQVWQGRQGQGAAATRQWLLLD